jgi:hypothetical protein
MGSRSRGKISHVESMIYPEYNTRTCKEKEVKCFTSIERELFPRSWYHTSFEEIVLFSIIKDPAGVHC